MNTINEIVVTNGKVIGISEKKTGAKILTVLVNTNGKASYFRFIKRADGAALPETLEKGNYVDIKGYCRSYSSQNEGKWSTSQYFIIDEIELAKPLLDGVFNVHGKYHGPASYCYKLRGTVVKVRNDEKWIKLTVRTDEDNPSRKASYVHISMKANNERSQIKLNDIIVATCIVSTPKKEVNGRTIYFEDIIVSDIAVA